VGLSSLCTSIGRQSIPTVPLGAPGTFLARVRSRYNAGPFVTARARAASPRARCLRAAPCAAPGERRWRVAARLSGEGERSWGGSQAGTACLLAGRGAHPVGHAEAHGHVAVHPFGPGVRYDLPRHAPPGLVGGCTGVHAAGPEQAPRTASSTLAIYGETLSEQIATTEAAVHLGAGARTPRGLCTTAKTGSSRTTSIGNGGVPSGWKGESVRAWIEMRSAPGRTVVSSVLLRPFTTMSPLRIRFFAAVFVGKRSGSSCCSASLSRIAGISPASGALAREKAGTSQLGSHEMPYLSGCRHHQGSGCCTGTRV
jgi:hypothetical protein